MPLPGVSTFSDRSNETVFDTKSRRDALRIAQDASLGISRRCRGSPIGTFEAALSVPYASIVAFDPLPFYLGSKTHNGQIGLHGYAQSCFLYTPFHTSLRDYRLVFSPCPRSSSWATVKPSLRDYRLFFSVSQEFLLGYSQTVPTRLTCPSCDPMRGVSSSVMHKVHRTKMYKLQKAPRCCFYRRHGILAALDLVFVWHISFCRLLWYAWDCIVGGFGVRARRAGIQRREPVRRGSEM